MEAVAPIRSIASYFCLPYATPGCEEIPFSSSGVLLSLNPSCKRIAAAVQNEVAVFALTGASAASEHDGKGAPLGASTCGQDSITALQWVTWEVNLHQPHGHEERSAGSKPSPSFDTTADQNTPSSTATADQNTPASTATADQNTPSSTATPEHNAFCLIVGTAAGYVQLHDINGLVLQRQRLHTQGPVQRIQVQPRAFGCSMHDHTEGVTVTLSNAIVHIPSAAIHKSLTSCLATRAHADAVAAQAAATGGVTGAWSAAMAWAAPSSAQAFPAPEVMPMAPCLKWSMPRNVGPRFDALLLGPRPRSLYEVLQGDAPYTWHRGGNEDDDDGGDNDCSGGEDGEGCEGQDATAAGSVVLATAGQGPALAALDAPAAAGHRGGGIGALAYSLYDYARSARSQVSLSGPSSLRQGIKSFLLAPLLSWESKGSQPLATFDDPAASCGQGGAMPSQWKCMRDDARTIKALVPAPRGTLLAALDNLGRVLLVDAASQIGVLRMLKGYRDATCGWLEIPSTLVQQCLEAQQGQLQGQQGQEGLRQALQQGQRQELQKGLQQGIWQGLQQGLEAQQGLHRHEGSLDGRMPGVQASGLTPEHLHAPPGSAGSCSSTTLVLVIHAPRKQMVEAWLPPYGPRLHVLHRPGSWMLVQPPPQLDTDGSGIGQSKNHSRVAGSGSALDRRAGHGVTHGGLQSESHMDMEETAWGTQGSDLAHKRQEEYCRDAQGCSQSCSSAGTFQGQGDKREELGGSAQGEGWSSPCNTWGEEVGAGRQGQRLPALASVAGVDRSLALSGCWLLDPSTGTLSSLSALLTLELAASVLRLKAGPC